MSDLIPNTPIQNEGYERQKSLVLELLQELSLDKNFIGQSMPNKATILQWELNKRIFSGSYGDREGHLPAGSTPLAVMSQEDILEFIEDKAEEVNPVRYDSEELINDAIQELSHDYPWFSLELILDAYRSQEYDIAFKTTIPSIKAQLVLDEMRAKAAEEKIQLLDVVRYQMRDIIQAVLDLHITEDSQEI